MADNRHFSLIGNFNEYAFARAIDEYNRSVFKGINGGSHVILASEARSIHDKFTSFLTNVSSSIDTERDINTLATALAVSIDDSVAPTDDMNEFAKRRVRYYLDIDRYVGDYCRLTGVDDFVRDVSDKSLADMGRLPMSPYDPRFSTRETFRNHNTILYADFSTMLESLQDTDGRTYWSYATDPEGEQDVDVFTLTGSKPVGKAMSMEDVCGLSVLKPYMSDRNYQKAQISMRQYFASPNPSFVSSEGIQRAADILQMLTDEGYDYEVLPDRYPGQLKARIVGSKTEIRILDRGNNENYIGRVYIDGMGLYARIDDQYPRGNARDGVIPERWKPAKEETLALIKYSLGERQARVNATGRNFSSNSSVPNSEYIGGSYMFRPRSRNGSASVEEKRGTMMVVSGKNPEKPYFRTVVGRSVNRNASGYNPLVTIGCDNNRNASHVFFDSQADAIGFLQRSIDSARKQFMDRVNVQGLIEYSDRIRAWQADHPGEDWTDMSVSGIKEFNFDSNSAIEFRQREYLRVLLDDSIELRPPNSDLVSRQNSNLMDSDDFGLDEFDEDFDFEHFGEVEEEVVSEDDILRSYPIDQYPDNRARVLRHIEDVTDYTIGRFSELDDGLTFDPALVSMFMDSPDNLYRNNDNLIEAMYTIGMDGSTLRGDSFQVNAIKDHLLRPVDIVETMDPDAKDENGNPIEHPSESTIVYIENDVESVDVDGEQQEIPVVRGVMYSSSYENGSQIVFEKKGEPGGEVPLVSLNDLPDGSVIRMADLTTPYMKSILKTIIDTAEDTGCEINTSDVFIDSNGVVQYTAKQFAHFNGPERGEHSYTAFGDEVKKMHDEVWTVHGTLGQIFEPDEKGIVETKYNGSENRLFVPGYDARILPPSVEYVNEPLLSRVRLRGLEQSVCRSVASMIRQDLLGGGSMSKGVVDDNGVIVSREKSVGSVTNVNSVYSHVSRTLLRVHVKPELGMTLREMRDKELEMTHFPKEIDDARLVTMSNRVSFDKRVMEGSTISAISNLGKMKENEVFEFVCNDNKLDPLIQTGVRNMSNPASTFEEGIDPVCTGTGRSQGKIVYLANGVSVGNDGRVILPKDSDSSLTAINTIAENKYLWHSPADRVMMVDNNLIDALGVSKRTGIAHLTLQGFTFDDGAVVSKHFAERNGIVNDDGEIRALKAGDKICDFSGNKSIIARVVDPDMPDEEAEKLGILPSVKLFRANPDLEVVQAPYAPVSRYNGAVCCSLMDNSAPLTMPDGSVVEGGMGYSDMMITVHTADDHTRQYDDDDIKAGRGRSFSALLVASMYSQNCYNILSEVFSNNTRAIDDMRENVLVLGVTMGQDTRLSPEIDMSSLDKRKLFTLPPEDEVRALKPTALADVFKERVDSQGGLMELPFPLTLMSGATTPKLETEDGSERYALPIMSARLRSGQRFEDGTSMTHDYTNQYTRIYQAALEYIQADGDEKKQGRAIAAAQAAYQSIAEPLKTRMFDTKHNVARDLILSVRSSRSATAVWTPNPNLDLDQVAMNGQMMKALGLEEGQYVCLWRDPLLRENGVRYMRVALDDNITGVAVNPLSAKTFDGDFDGDSVGLKAFSTKAADLEAHMKLSFEAHLLDATVVRDGTKFGRKGDFALFVNDSMDVASAEARDEKLKAEALARGEDYGPTLRERRADIEARANDLYRNSELSRAERVKMSHELLVDLSSWARDALCDSVATEHLVYKDPSTLMQSLVNIVDHGAKGNMRKLGMFMKNAGFECDKDDDGNLLPNTAVRLDRPLTTMEDVIETQKATAIKTEGTGLAGAHTQRAAILAQRYETFRDYEQRYDIDPLHDSLKKERYTDKGIPEESTLDIALKLTYLSTQGLLQAKHDAVQAQKLYSMVGDPISNLWRGRRMEKTSVLNDDGSYGTAWVPVRSSDGQTVQASKEEWISTFLEMHESDEGLELAGAINHDHVARIADSLCGPDGVMLDIEDPDVLKDRACLIDRLAYKPATAWTTFLEAAHAYERLFDGPSVMVAPKAVVQSIVLMDDYDKYTSLANQEPDAEKAEAYRQKAEECLDRYNDKVHAPKDVGTEYDRLKGRHYDDLALDTVSASEMAEKRKANPDLVERVSEAESNRREHMAFVEEREESRARLGNVGKVDVPDVVEKEPIVKQSVNDEIVYNVVDDSAVERFVPDMSDEPEVEHRSRFDVSKPVSTEVDGASVDHSSERLYPENGETLVKAYDELKGGESVQPGKADKPDGLGA